MGVAGRVWRRWPLYSFVWLSSFPVLYGVFRLRVCGAENVPTSGGFVLAANHESNFDPWPMALPLFPSRIVHFMSRAELFNSIIGPPLRAVGGFPVQRGADDGAAIATAVDLVRAGEVVGIFPEGARARKGLRRTVEPRPRTGAARIALEAGAPLVPAAINGTDRLLRLPRLSVRYGRPVDLDGTSVETATDRLMAAIADLRAVV